METARELADRVAASLSKLTTLLEGDQQRVLHDVIQGCLAPHPTVEPAVCPLLQGYPMRLDEASEGLVIAGAKTLDQLVDGLRRLRHGICERQHRRPVDLVLPDGGLGAGGDRNRDPGSEYPVPATDLPTISCRQRAWRST